MKAILLAAAAAFALAAAAQAQQPVQKAPTPQEKQALNALAKQKAQTEKQYRETAAKIQQLQPSVQSCQKVLAANQSLHKLLADLKTQNAAAQQKINQAPVKKFTPQDAQKAQLELQEAMQRQQRMFQILSNLLKAQHETSKQIIQNLK